MVGYDRLMAKIVNLNRARKAKARDDRKREADASAMRFGRTKARREAERAETYRASRHLDDHERE